MPSSAPCMPPTHEGRAKDASPAPKLTARGNSRAYVAPPMVNGTEGLPVCSR